MEDIFLRPVITDELQNRLEEIRLENGIAWDKPCLIAIRGFLTNGNKIGIYDDAIFLMCAQGYTSFTANVDPSDLKQHMATLQCGKWEYKQGLHGFHTGRPYPALVQAAPITVNRHNDKPQTGMFAINIHKGGITSTGSLGCQTIHPYQWEEFIVKVYEAMNLAEVKTIPYVLVEHG
jgi:lysozyme